MNSQRKSVPLCAKTFIPYTWQVRWQLQKKSTERGNSSVNKIAYNERFTAYGGSPDSYPLCNFINASQIWSICLVLLVWLKFFFNSPRDSLKWNFLSSRERITTITPRRRQFRVNFSRLIYWPRSSVKTFRRNIRT